MIVFKDRAGPHHLLYNFIVFYCVTGNMSKFNRRKKFNVVQQAKRLRPTGLSLRADSCESPVTFSSVSVSSPALDGVPS